MPVEVTNGKTVTSRPIRLVGQNQQAPGLDQSNWMAANGFTGAAGSTLVQALERIIASGYA